MTSIVRQLNHLPDELWKMILDFHPFFVSHIRCYGICMYINGMLTVKKGCNLLAYQNFVDFYSYGCGEIHWIPNAYGRSKKPRGFFFYEWHVFMETNTEDTIEE